MPAAKGSARTPLGPTVLVELKEERNDKNTLSCDQCEFKTRDRSNLGIHKRSVHQGINYKCEKCDFVAVRPNHLKLHDENVHLGIRYKCDYCDYKATTPGNLKIHRDNQHLKIKKEYSCKSCDFKTACQSSLSQHRIATHTEEKEKFLKRCQFCEYTSFRTYTLRNHVQSVHEGVKYKCEVEGCNFETKKKQ